MCVYDRINEIRKRKGVTWKHLNENIPGAYSSRMTEFKNGKTTLSKQQLEIVADILETTTDYLLGNTDDPRPAGQKETLSQEGGQKIGFDSFLYAMKQETKDLPQEKKDMLLNMARFMKQEEEKRKQQ